MDKIRYAVRFNRKNKLNKLGLAPVQIECLLNRKRRFFDTKIKVSPNDWDYTKRRVNKSHPNALKLNQRINQLLTQFEEYELSFLNAKKPFNLSMFDNLFKPPMYNNFNEFMEYEIKNSKHTEATKKSQLSTLNRLNQFRKNIDFDAVTFEFLHDFERFCRKQTISISGDKKYLSENTIWKYFKNIKTYVNLAINKELISIEKYPFRKFKFRLKETEKTGEKVKIPIYAIFNGKALDIIKKYWDLSRSRCFQYLTNQHINRALKTISKLAGINKNITFHTARHTTATFLLYKGANISVVQKILGHKKISTTQIYGHIMDITIENEIKTINF